ncbi:MAG TPA: Asp-tRNA(Asn)/Glu-tRNA(Gln) amidotransferase subunit GatA, partial [candidate division Zixibacteria bacterium]|nr:Asp-tRNA(Asn)/Glu-tRNA(Gln) amidotransferase subunit GatA [candidate division Zixibacteria bacterium]
MRSSICNASKVGGIPLNAFITLTEEKAMRQAEEIDSLVRQGKADSLPLAGVPVAVKDNICYRDYPTTCASKMLERFVSPYDATVVKRLVEAGAVIVGKTNMDEFAMGSSSETSFFGPVKNPLDSSLVPGGSSGGSAAAVAARIVPVALGSDTGGSVRQPAAFCGVYGLKPTYGTVSRYGLVAFASSLDQIGPIARTVDDIELLYRVIAGRDDRDATSTDIPDMSAQPDSDRKFRVGIPREYFGDGLDDEVLRGVEKAMRLLRNEGHEVVDLSLPLTDKAIAIYYIIASAEASSNLARYDGVRFGHRTNDYNDLFEMYAKTRAEGFGSEVKRRIMLGTFVLSAGYYDQY